MSDMANMIAEMMAWMAVAFFIIGTVGGWIVLYFVGRDFYTDMQVRRAVARRPRYSSPDPDYPDEHEVR